MLEKDAVLSKISTIKRCLDTIKRATNLEIKDSGPALNEALKACRRY